MLKLGSALPPVAWHDKGLFATSIAVVEAYLVQYTFKDLPPVGMLLLHP